MAMVWGYRLAGYGAYRTKRAIDSTDKFAEKIYDIAEVARDHGGLAAYRYIGDQRRLSADYLRHAGPAFGTKFLYFVTKASAQPAAPVMDTVVQRWFDRNAPGVPLKLDRSSPESYERYLAALSAWARELSRDGEVLHADDVEYLIYTSGAAVEGFPDPVHSASQCPRHS